MKTHIELLCPDIQVTLCLVETAGDRDAASSLSSMPIQGVFTKELDRGLLENQFDWAVHSLKDLPSRYTDGIAPAAIPEREDPGDALCSRNGLRLDELPSGATVGTSSPRRRALIVHRRPDLHVRDIRGNIDTRLRKLAETGIYDAIVLACAGLRRLDLVHHMTERFDPIEWPPAAGQGALAVTVRSDDAVDCGTNGPPSHTLRRNGGTGRP